MLFPASLPVVAMATLQLAVAFAKLSANEKGSREDAELDPPMKVMMKEAPESALFRHCIAAAYTVTGTFFTMETTSDNEYQRYVPDQSMQLNPVWDTVTQRVSNIFECAEACDSTPDCYMFKYDGTDCKVTLNNAYDLSIEPMCENGVKVDAVFVLTTAPVAPDNPCAFYVNEDATICVSVAVGNVQSQTDGQNLCETSYGTGASVYGQEHEMTTADIEAKLTDMGYTQDLLINAVWAGTLWMLADSDAPIGSDAQVTGGLPPWDPFINSKLYMKATDNFKLHAASQTDIIPAALCVIIL